MGFEVRGVGLVVALMLGCATDSKNGGGSGGTDTEGTTTGSTSSTTAASTGAATDGGGGDARWARGVVFTGMEANQGVAVQLFDENLQWNDGNSRNAPLIRDRITLFRVYVDVADGWTPRDIEGRLTLTPETGDPLAATRVVTVMGDSDPAMWDSSFNFIVPADAIQAGLSFSVELFEVDDALDGEPIPDPAPVLPADGPALVGIEDNPMEVKLVLVPIHHKVDTCDKLAVISDDHVEAVRKMVTQLNPVQSVSLEMRDPVEVTTAGSGGLVPALTAARTADAPEPNVYYAGFVDPCGSLDGTTCLAASIPSMPTKGFAQQRVMWVNSSLPSTTAVADSLMHCLGLNQGRTHVSCTGNEPGTDPGYPYEGGVIGVWGFDIVDTVPHAPDTPDYLSFCANPWVSDYGWEKAAITVKELTSWDYE